MFWFISQILFFSALALFLGLSGYTIRTVEELKGDLQTSLGTQIRAEFVRNFHKLVAFIKQLPSTSLPLPYIWKDLAAVIIIYALFYYIGYQGQEKRKANERTKKEKERHRKTHRNLAITQKLLDDTMDDITRLEMIQYEQENLVRCRSFSGSNASVTDQVHRNDDDDDDDDDDDEWQGFSDD